ncbi:MAG: type II toxin-antitoxin system RelE/ParE family toxin [Planctomycetaceae bacterium]|nr:type II toxin-antitoxin system RelE/ParE family toxin [Planctomycetaceae bacterium]
MTEVNWLYKATKQLNDLLDYVAIEHDRPTVAEKLIEEIYAKAEQYARQPLMGTPRFDLLPDLRFFTHKRYVLFYVPIEDGILIRAVIDSSRDFDSLID